MGDALPGCVGGDGGLPELGRGGEHGQDGRRRALCAQELNRPIAAGSTDQARFVADLAPAYPAEILARSLAAAPGRGNTHETDSKVVTSPGRPFRRQTPAACWLATSPI